MQIKEINVYKLFGLFDHHIALKCDEHVTIIHAPNGFGKTVILKIISGLFNSYYEPLYIYPFETFEISFTDNSKLIVKKHQPEAEEKASYSSSTIVSLIYSKEGIELEKYQLPYVCPNELMHLPSHIIDKEIPEIVRVGAKLWRDRQTGQLIQMNDIARNWWFRIAQYVDPLNTKVQELIEPEWLDFLKRNLSVKLIDTQRLYSSAYTDDNKNSHSVLKPSTTIIRNNLTKLIKEHLSDFARMSQSLDQTFPKRLLEDRNVEVYDEISLKTELDILSNKRKAFVKAGLLDSTEDSDFSLPAAIDETTRRILSLYIHDSKQKLSALEQLANQIDLFTTLINTLFTFKKVSITKNEGILLKDLNGQIIDPAVLSSGEQHELIILYELLFNTSPGSLVLIDEPEISLHIAWQQELLNNLTQITSLLNFDILIATHSPGIISGHWDLVVDLEDNSDGKAI